MPDRTIPFYNLILKCASYSPQNVCLPDGFSIVPYKEGFEKGWAKSEYDIGDFSSAEQAERYFADTYMKNVAELRENGFFLLNGRNEIVGSCLAWHDLRNGKNVSSLHWLIVDEKYQGLGLGKALCRHVMNEYAKRDRLPVYIHTQPWSWKAVLLYLSLGFRIQKTDTFANYVNQYEQAVSTLKTVLNDEMFERVIQQMEE